MANARGKAGTLYVVATPIGNLSDASYRMADTLRAVQVIAAEDTRQTAKLCARYSIDTAVTAYHEHNEVQQTPVLLQRLSGGDDVALVSDAGSPLISDPGYRLVAAAHDAEVPVVPVPGPCAAIAAVSAAGLACHRFHFEGFLPPKAGARRRRLEAMRRLPDTLIFYESGRRLEGALEDMAVALGAQRRGSLARELTKLHETILRSSLQGLRERVAADPRQLKGEHVILVEGAPEHADDDAERVLDILCAELPVSRAAELAAKITGAPRNRLYRLALAKKEDE